MFKMLTVPCWEAWRCGSSTPIEEKAGEARR